MFFNLLLVICNPIRCVDSIWEHNDNRNDEAGYAVGENLAWNSQSISDSRLLSSVQSWYDEISDYDFATGNCDVSYCTVVTKFCMVSHFVNEMKTTSRRWILRLIGEIVY